VPWTLSEAPMRSVVIHTFVQRDTAIFTERDAPVQSFVWRGFRCRSRLGASAATDTLS